MDWVLAEVVSHNNRLGWGSTGFLGQVKPQTSSLPVFFGGQDLDDFKSLNFFKTTNLGVRSDPLTYCEPPHLLALSGSILVVATMEPERREKCEIVS